MTCSFINELFGLPPGCAARKTLCIDRGMILTLCHQIL